MSDTPVTAFKNVLKISPLFGRLSALQRQLKVKKANYNSFSKFYYRSAEDILEAVKPLLLANECLSLSDEIILVGDRYYLVASATLNVNEEETTVEGWAREPDQIKGMTSPQITGSCSSFARKYALNGLFALDNSESDPDVSPVGTLIEAADESPHTDAQLEALFMRLVNEVKVSQALDSLVVIWKKSEVLSENYRSKLTEILKKQRKLLSEREASSNEHNEPF